MKRQKETLGTQRMIESLDQNKFYITFRDNQNKLNKLKKSRGRKTERKSPKTAFKTTLVLLESVLKMDNVHLWIRLFFSYTPVSGKTVFV